MATILTEQLYDRLNYATIGLFDQLGDPRVSHYKLLRSPFPVLIATAMYLWFVKRAGPKMMKNRKPYNLLPLIRVYNLAMASWNLMGFIIACHLLDYGRDAIGCVPVDSNDRSERTLTTIFYGWMFLVSRLIEFADTIFFVLRKKDRQISGFHVFHHSVVPTVVWSFMKFTPGGNAAIFPLVNTLVHTIMYSYYYLATYAKLQPYLGWKRYLTQMQIVQFLIIIACCVHPTLIPTCKTPYIIAYIEVGFSIIFIGLFTDFYLRNYRQQQQHKSKLAKTSQQNGLATLDNQTNETKSLSATNNNITVNSRLHDNECKQTYEFNSTTSMGKDTNISSRSLAKSINTKEQAFNDLRKSELLDDLSQSTHDNVRSPLPQSKNQETKLKGS